MRPTLTQILVLVCTLAMLTAGCTPAQKAFLSRPQIDFDKVKLDIQVQPTDELGEYIVSGTADLPQETELTVAAIRYLHLSQATIQTADLKPTYAILAYDVVQVKGDRWRTRLPLWQIAPNGEFKETWQLHEPDLALAVEPEEGVLFLVTLAPIHNLQEIEQQLAIGNQQIASRFIHITSEGSRYLQTGEMVKVDLPTRKTTPPGEQPEDINGGWGNRYLPLPDPPNTRQLEFPEHRQTNAPVAREELLY
ncbi:MAG: hypothetical protein AAGE59_21090 [Cyanobacteria bacterium P01_F01_bin.86]